MCYVLFCNASKATVLCVSLKLTVLKKVFLLSSINPFLIIICGLHSWGILNFRMETARFHQALGTAQSHQHLQNSGSHHEFGNASLKLISKGFKLDVGLSIRGCYSSCMRNIQASTSQTSVVQSVSYTPNNSSDELRRKSSMPFYFSPKFISIED